MSETTSKNCTVRKVLNFWRRLQKDFSRIFCLRVTYYRYYKFKKNLKNIMTILRVRYFEAGSIFDFYSFVCIIKNVSEP